MTMGVTTLLLVLLLTVSFAHLGRDKRQPQIVAGEGWGAVRLNATRSSVESVIGKGENLGSLSILYRYSLDYTDFGISIQFSSYDHTVQVIYFFNKERGSERFHVFAGETAKGINWSSSEDQLLRAYGKPKFDFEGKDKDGTWRRLVFDGIDFRFENNRLVRIGVPGI